MALCGGRADDLDDEKGEWKMIIQYWKYLLCMHEIVTDLKYVLVGYISVEIL